MLQRNAVRCSFCGPSFKGDGRACEPGGLPALELCRVIPLHRDYVPLPSPFKGGQSCFCGPPFEGTELPLRAPFQGDGAASAGPFLRGTGELVSQGDYPRLSCVALSPCIGTTSLCRPPSKGGQSRITTENGKRKSDSASVAQSRR
jgi:hypothetical protein